MIEKQCKQVLTALFKADEEYALLKKANEVYDNERDVIDWAHHITALQRIITARLALHDYKDELKIVKTLTNHKDELKIVKTLTNHKHISIIMTNNGEIMALATEDLLFPTPANAKLDRYRPILEVDYWDEADHMVKFISEKVQLLVDNNSGSEVCIYGKGFTYTTCIPWKDYNPKIHFLIARGDKDYVSKVSSEENGYFGDDKYKVICQGINGKPNIFISDEKHPKMGTILSTHGTIREAYYSKALYKFRLSHHGDNPLAM